VHWNWLNQQPQGIPLIVGILGIYLLLVAIIGIGIRLRHTRRRRRRERASTRAFLKRLGIRIEAPGGYVEVVRHAIGAAYDIDPHRLFPEDRLNELTKLGLDHPFAFEVVLGAAERLGLSLSDDDLDEIIHEIRLEARTIGDVAAITARGLWNWANRS
jgi:hypothetical protein